MNDETALVTRQPRDLEPWTPKFAISVDMAVEMVKQKQDFFHRVMTEGQHYGVIPGTTDKPVLRKAGAELLLSAMGLGTDSSIDATPPIIDLKGADHGGEAFVQFHKIAEIYRFHPETGERIVIARASGNCNSWEKKYRFRRGERTCPACGQATIIKGKKEYGGGWICFAKKGGCGAKWKDGDQAIESQVVGDVPNPDIADLVNTIEKMAEKRALVAATLNATGCSDIFTQDVEDFEDGTQTTAQTTEVADDLDPGPSAEEMATLIRLAATLPTPRDEKRVADLVKQYGYAATYQRVVAEHSRECGPDCAHLTAIQGELV